MPTLTVPLGPRSYPIEIGTPLAHGFADFARRLAPKAKVAFVVGDTNEPEVEGHSYLALQEFLGTNGKSRYCTLAESQSVNIS